MKKLFAAVAVLSFCVAAQAAEDAVGDALNRSMAAMLGGSEAMVQDAVGESLARSMAAILVDPAAGRLALQRQATRECIQAEAAAVRAG